MYTSLWALRSLENSPPFRSSEGTRNWPSSGSGMASWKRIMRCKRMSCSEGVFSAQKSSRSARCRMPCFCSRSRCLAFFRVRSIGRACRVKSRMMRVMRSMRYCGLRKTISRTCENPKCSTHPT